MENTSYISLSRQMVMHHQMDVIANNLANMTTPGFKSERATFAEQLQSVTADEELSFVQNRAVLRDPSPGVLERTGNPLDVAINGKGYFTVQTPQGIKYTRDGSWQLDAEGTIVTTDGFPILSDSDQPIVLGDDQLGAIVIGRDGSISTSKGSTLGRLKVVMFEDDRALRSDSGNLLTSDGTEAIPKPVENPQISQGMIENSNVVPITEMTNMIDISRGYQSIQKMLETEHELQRKAIQVLAQTA